MNPPKIATGFLLLSISSVLLVILRYSSANYEWKMVSANVNGTSGLQDGNDNISIDERDHFNKSNYYVHGCYYKGPIGTPQLLLNEDTLKFKGCVKRPPQVIIFGVRKSGTTTLRDFLSFHPQLAVADTEIHYLEFLSRNTDGRSSYATKFKYGESGNSIRITDGGSYRNDFQPKERLKTYASLMPYSTPEQLVVEKTPKYFVCKDCPILLKKMIPDCKLIAILGDPVKRVMSDYLHVVNSVITESYSRQLGMKETFEKTMFHENGLVKFHSPFIDIGIYKKHIQRWLNVFSKENILLLDGGEFVRRPENVLQQVEDFLGLNPFFTSEMFTINKTKGFFCLKSPVYTCMGNRTGRKHPYIASADVIKKLQLFYQPHNEECTKLVNQTFSWTRYT